MHIISLYHTQRDFTSLPLYTEKPHLIDIASVNILKDFLK